MPRIFLTMTLKFLYIQKNTIRNTINTNNMSISKIIILLGFFELLRLVVAVMQLKKKNCILD